MTIDEAIKILTVLEARSINNSLMFKKDALKLGIEAINFYSAWKRRRFSRKLFLLPGETEEILRNDAFVRYGGWNKTKGRRLTHYNRNLDPLPKF